jgi:predicted ArsR family transcriptional regulator
MTHTACLTSSVRRLNEVASALQAQEAAVRAAWDELTLSTLLNASLGDSFGRAIRAYDAALSKHAEEVAALLDRPVAEVQAALRGTLNASVQIRQMAGSLL